MYLARIHSGGQTLFVLRQSHFDGEKWCSRDILELGPDPGTYLIYPGGNSFFVSDLIQDAIAATGAKQDYDLLEDLFWPFVRADVRAALEGFRGRDRVRAGSLSEEEKRFIMDTVHDFDKRRLHFLKYGEIDQSQVHLAPPKLFKRLLNKSRDELEQYFLSMENDLPRTEFKEYVYAAFNLQRFFPQVHARTRPQALDQDLLDQHFLEELCELDRDERLWTCFPEWDGLNDYLARYAFMFFDHDFGPDPFWEQYVRSFISAHRRPVRFTPKPKIDTDRCAVLFGVPFSTLKEMTKPELIALFRKRAKAMHPDRGGEHDVFVELLDMYKCILHEKRT